MNGETKYYILTINGTQKFLIASVNDFDAQVWNWIDEGTKIYGDELRYKSITGGALYLTGKTALIIPKNAATLVWEKAESIQNTWFAA